MAKTCEWEKVRGGQYTSTYKGHNMAVQRIPHSTYYSVFVDDLKVCDRSNISSAKTSAIKHVERMSPCAPAAVPAPQGWEEVEADVPAMMPAPTFEPTYSVALNIHYIGDTKNPNKLIEELRNHVEAIRQLGGEIEADVEVTGPSEKIKL